MFHAINEMIHGSLSTDYDTECTQIGANIIRTSKPTGSLYLWEGGGYRDPHLSNFLWHDIYLEQ